MGLPPQEKPAAASPPPNPVVRGVVLGMSDGERSALPYALVEVVLSRGTLAVLADGSGHYLVAGVPSGPTRVRARHVGYGPTEVEVLIPDSGAVILDLVLQAIPVPLPSIVVGVDPIRIPAPDERPVENTSDGALVRLRALEATSGIAESGLPDAVRSLPGNDPTDPTDVLLMRGSTADLKLVLLDGAPVYTPFHTGGLLPSFDLSALGTAAHYVGGAPARYDGGLTYILDLRTRPARRDRMRARGTADLLSVQGGLEMPLTRRGGVMAVARALHDGVSPWAVGGASPYGYQDGLVRADFDVSASGRLSLTGFTNREEVRLDVPPSPTSPGIERASWGNDALALNYGDRVGPITLDFGFAMTRYQAELPVLRILSDTAAIATPETGSSTEIAKGTTDRTRLTLDAVLPAIAGGLRFGGSLDRVAVEYGTTDASAMSVGAGATGWVGGLYVDAVRRLASEWSVRYGGRIDRFQPGGTKTAARVAVLWSLAPDALLTLAGGRYHQLNRLVDTRAELAVGETVQVGLGPVPGSPGSPLLQVATADHLALSLEQVVSPQVRLALEGFLKSFRGLGALPEGDLSSSGVDLRVVREGRDLTGWLGYSLSWFWETSPGSEANFSGRHLLSAGLRGRVSGPVGVDVRLSFSDGLPLTAIPFGNPDRSADAEEPLGEVSSRASTGSLYDGFLRLDAEIFAEWQRRWGGKSFYLRPYVRVLNALNSRDALFHYFEPWRDNALRPLANLPIIPVVGFQWRF